MDASFQVRAILRADLLRWHRLQVVHALNLPDAWIAAGFVRNAVWDHLHQRSLSPPTGDVDVIWYDPRQIDASEDIKHEAALRAAEPSITWSVKNQARMHQRNGDTPYASATEAMRYWPETATAVAARWQDHNDCEIAAPLGLDDLLAFTSPHAPLLWQEAQDLRGPVAHKGMHRLLAKATADPSVGLITRGQAVIALLG
jgi:hypothetical protein